MIELATALPAIATAPAKPSLALPAGAGGFALALGALLPGVGPAVPALEDGPGGAETLLPARQPLAGGGKDLPGAALDLDGAEDEDAGSEDEGAPDESPAPPFAWFAVAAPAAPQPEAAPEAGPQLPTRPASEASGEIPLPMGATVGDAPSAGAKALAEMPSRAAAGEIAKPAATPKNEAPAKPETAMPQAPAPAMPEPGTVPQPQGKRPDAALAHDGPTAPTVTARPGAAPTPVAPAQAPPERAAAPAAQVPLAAPTPDPGAGPSAASAPTATRPAAAGETTPHPDAAPIADMPAPPRDFRRPDAPMVRIEATAPARVPVAAETVTPKMAPLAGPLAPFQEVPARRPAPREPLAGEAAPITAAGAAPAAPAVIATGHGQQPALDTRRQEWTGQMIERIEALRDAAPARETRLSLMPEALGKVDISIRHDGEGVHVHFNTETQAARQLIADAQPRLNEIAEQRGLRLGSTSVESGGAGNAHAGQGQRQDAAPRPPQPSAPARARADTPTQTDERIA